MSALQTTNWREVVNHPDIHIVAELIGGTGVAREIIEAAIARGKSVVTANKELMALTGAELWDQAIAAGINLAMEASVAGGIPIHAVLREGISGDRITTLYGILNGTCNYILTEIEQRGAGFEQGSGGSAGRRLRGSRSFRRCRWLRRALQAGDSFGAGVRRAHRAFRYLHRRHPPHHADRFRIRAHAASHHPPGVRGARRRPTGLLLSVRPSLIPQSTILASVRGAYNAVWVRGKYGADTFYYGRGAGPHPTGVAVVSDLMRVAREIRSGSPERVSPFAHARLGENRPIPVTLNQSAYYLRFRVKDRPGIIAQLATALAAENISIDAVLQLPDANWRDLPFVITVEPATEASIRAAIARMAELNFLIEPPLAMPMELPL